MADVLIVCVREDETQAKALADMFEGAGFTVGGAPANDGALRSTGAGIIVWSQASIRSRPFLDAAQRVVNAGKAVLACLIDPPPPDSVEHAPAFDLTGWDGDAQNPALDPLFFAVDRMVNSARAAVGAAPPQAPAAFTPPPNLRPPPEQPYARSRSGPATPRAPVYDPPRPAPATPQDYLGTEADHWRMIRHSKDPNDFFEYLAKYGPDGEFSEVAELRLKQLSPDGAPPPSLKSAARAAQTEPQQRPYEPPRSYDPPPQRRPEPPPRRPEPPVLPPPPRRAEAPPQRRYDAPAPAPMPAPPRARDTRLEREYRPIDDRGRDTAPKKESGGVRNLVLMMLVVGALIVGGIYFGLGDKLQTMFAGSDEATTTDVASVPPVGEPADATSTPSEESYAANTPDLSDPTPSRAAPLASVRPTQPAPQPASTRQTASTQASRQQPESPIPAPQTSWTAPTTSLASSTANTSSAGGPVSLLPGSQSSSTPSQIVPIAPQPTTTQPPTPVSAPQSRSTPTGSLRWAQRPSASRISALYPHRALRDGTNGSVMLDCTVRPDLGASCTVAIETPPGNGFGAAALQAAAAYRAQPTLSDGSSAVGARTRISILFQQASDNGR